MSRLFGPACAALYPMLGPRGVTFGLKSATIRPGSSTVRAVVSDFAGYLQYGYSAARALKVS